MKKLNDLPAGFGTPVLVRASLNVPIERGAVRSSYRLRRAVPTIQTLVARGAKVIVIGHIGEDPLETLAPVAKTLAQYVERLTFFPGLPGPALRDAVRAMEPGDVLVVENLRKHPGEKGNDPAFARELASCADYFVQDAFDACHRYHASIVTLPSLLPSFAGISLAAELEALARAARPSSPSLAIMGGAKFSTKHPLIRKLLAEYDEVFVGGAVLHDVMLARGYEIGRSFAAHDPASVKDFAEHPKLRLPEDVMVATGSGRAARPLSGVLATDTIYDAGPEAVAALSSRVIYARSVLWNGPLGNYEKGFHQGDQAVLRALAQSHAWSVIGGGDTVASVEALHLEEKVGFISVGGGAMLQYLADGTLPGVRALS